MLRCVAFSAVPRLVHLLLSAYVANHFGSFASLHVRLAAFELFLYVFPRIVARASVVLCAKNRQNSVGT